MRLVWESLPPLFRLSALPAGSRAVVCTHSGVMYPLMEAFGIDTVDPVKFPRKSNGKVKGFNDLWIVALDPVRTADGIAYQGRLLSHGTLDFQLSVTTVDAGVNRPARN